MFASRVAFAGDSSVQLNAGPNDEAASEENVKKRILVSDRIHSSDVAFEYHLLFSYSQP